MSVGTILVFGALALALLDLVLWHTTRYAQHVLLQLAVIVVCVALLVGAPALGS